MTSDRPAFGVVLMLGFCVIAPLGDAIAKVLGGTWPLLLLLVARFAIQFALLAPAVLASGKALVFSGRVWRLMAVRTALHIAGIGLMFQSLKYLPLADAIAIAFVMPFIMLLLGRFILHEEVGPRRLIACIVGFCGTLLVVQPSFVDVGAVALLPMAVAVVFALFMLVTRQIAREADPVTLQTVSGGIATLVLIGPTIWFGRELLPEQVSGWHIGLILAMGLLGTCAHLMMTWALRYAPTSTLAPMQYLEIPFAAIIGWLIFRDFPDGLALLGIAITIGSGLYIIARERRLALTGPAAPPPAPPAAE